MASVATLQIENLGTKTLQKGQLVKDILSVAEADYRTVLAGITAQEIAAQVAIGNKPSNVIVDGKANKPINQVQFSTVTYFTDVQTMLNAIADVWREVHRLSEVSTGQTIAQWQIWRSTRGGDMFVANSPSSIRPDTVTRAGGFMVAGPLVPHTRKYRFVTPGGVEAKYRMSRNKKWKRLAAKDRPRVKRSLHEIVVTMMRRKYPGLGFAEAWIKVPNLNPSGKTPVNKIPTVMVWFKKKGAV